MSLVTGPQVDLDVALDLIAAGAAERDAAPVPAFPEDAIAALEAAGVLAATIPVNGRVPAVPAAVELDLVRRVGRADASVSRILDGHLNAVERLGVHAEPELREAELARVAARQLRLGVWGADPGPGEGEPAWLERAGGAWRLHGVKTFCSGAGGLHRALVLARGPDREPGPPRAAWVDLTVAGTVEVDETWFRGAGMRASVSHRVVFHGAPVPALFGPPGALGAQPWFSRDALRTTATWVGAAEAAADAALDRLAARPGAGDLEGLTAARIHTGATALGLWTDEAARRMDAATASSSFAPGDRAGRELTVTAASARLAIADAARAILDGAERGLGSRPFATGGTLDRARRDLGIFLLQHRLEPIAARAGLGLIEERR